MKYFFISDVHGEFDKMVSALTAAGFDKQDDSHYLVSLGDLFDRGSKSKEVLEYVMSCPRRILCWGNHDARLRKLLLGSSIHSFDISNGVPYTIQSFCQLESKPNLMYGIQSFISDDRYKKIRSLLWQYFDECHCALEWDDLIATHAWLPVDGDCRYCGFSHCLDEDWRNADFKTWYNAFWAETDNRIIDELFPEKKLIIGHWHAWRIRGMFEPDKVTDPTTYETEHYIAIDGCSNAEIGIVNVYVYESQNLPQLIDPKR